MIGHIRRRGARSWELKFDIGVDATGQRQTRFHSFKGTKREAEIELAKLVSMHASGGYVDPDRLTVGDFLTRWESEWAPANVSAKTLERYRELLAHHVRPHIGAMRLQKLRTIDLAGLYGRLQRPKDQGGSGLAARSVGHVHRLLHRIFGHAVKWSLIVSNPASAADPPRVERAEVEILHPDQIKAVMAAIRGRWIRPIVMLALATGARRGELCGLRWRNVDMEAGRISIESSLEQTNAGLRCKEPKTKAGRRTVSIPPVIAGQLGAHWREQQEQRLSLGRGRSSGDDFVFARLEGEPIPPDTLSQEWARLVRQLKLPKVTFHALRHTHVSSLIRAGVDVVTVSRRIGHSNPSLTLNTYSHLFGNPDQHVAAIVERTMSAALAP
jgi:integrase